MTPLRLQGSQAALVTLAARARDVAVQQAEAEFQAALTTVLREHGLAAGDVRPDEATGGWLLVPGPAGAPLPFGCTTPTRPTIRRFSDVTLLSDEERARYEAIKQQARPAPADVPPPAGPALLAATGVDFGAFS